METCRSLRVGDTLDSSLALILEIKGINEAGKEEVAAGSRDEPILQEFV